ncbi:hypothetical protein BD289DRAFT_501951, partial [Coniella lustricola]
PQSVRDTNLLVNRRISVLREKGTSRASTFVAALHHLLSHLTATATAQTTPASASTSFLPLLPPRSIAATKDPFTP